MKREILFRGKSIDNGEWVEGTIHFNGKYILSNKHRNNYHEWVEIIPETVGQYTGIDDREGDKIFEGDIFKIGAENNIYTVRFDYGCFLAYDGNGEQVGILSELSTMFVKVIGNINDNKELLS